MDIVFPIQFVQGLIRSAAQNGISVDPVLTAKDLDIDSLKGLPFVDIYEIVQLLLEQSPFTTIFPFMRVINDDAIAEMLAIGACSKTLRECTKNLMEFGPFSAIGLNMHYAETAEQDVLNIDVTTHGEPLKLLVELGAGAFIRTLPPQFQGAKIVRQVEFSFPLQGCLEEYELFFGCPVVFEQSYNRIHVNKGVIHSDIQSYSPKALASATSALRTKTDTLLALQGYRFQTSLVVKERTRKQIQTQQGITTSSDQLDLSIDTIASELGMSARSLQRKLKLEECSYVNCKNQILVDELSKRLDVSSCWSWGYFAT